MLFKHSCVSNLKKLVVEIWLVMRQTQMFVSTICCIPCSVLSLSHYTVSQLLFTRQLPLQDLLEKLLNYGSDASDTDLVSSFRYLDLSESLSDKSGKPRLYRPYA